MKEIDKILGIDYGKKRIGTAIGFVQGKISIPQEVIENKNFDFALEEIRRIVKEEDIDLIVVGLPISLSGEAKSDQLKEVQIFINKLSDNINLEVDKEDERLSSKEAGNLLLGSKGGKRDDVAAMLILQSYMNKINV
jgi:putative holliday junction resolvase